MNTYITIQEASERIGVSIVSLHGYKNTKYQQFRHKPIGAKVVLFDILGYEKQANLMESLKAKAGLFIEYLREIEGITYSDMAILSKTCVSTLSDHSFGEKVALKLVRAFAIQRPYHLKRFDKYYSYKTAPIRKSVKILG